ncbi:MAG: hypothetical protein QG597_3706 [Actinomycetota bacterium]|nr:hypothetical protein [Actinomycetota bacterium]
MVRTGGAGGTMSEAGGDYSPPRPDQGVRSCQRGTATVQILRWQTTSAFAAAPGTPMRIRVRFR